MIIIIITGDGTGGHRDNTGRGHRDIYPSARWGGQHVPPAHGEGGGASHVSLPGGTQGHVPQRTVSAIFKLLHFIILCEWHTGL